MVRQSKLQKGAGSNERIELVGHLSLNTSCVSWVWRVCHHNDVLVAAPIPPLLIPLAKTKEIWEKENQTVELCVDGMSDPALVWAALLLTNEFEKVQGDCPNLFLRTNLPHIGSEAVLVHPVTTSQPATG